MQQALSHAAAGARCGCGSARSRRRTHRAAAPPRVCAPQQLRAAAVPRLRAAASDGGAAASASPLPQAASTPPAAAPTLAARVMASLQASAAADGPIGLLDDSLLAPDAAFVDDFGNTVTGREAYTRIAQKWAGIHAAEIGQPGQELSWRLLRCTSTGPDEVMVSWEATWIPQPMLPLVRFGRSWPGMQVTFYDLLDRVERPSAFSWRAAFALLAKAAATRVLPLPRACIRGAATLAFSRENGLLRRHAERLELTPVFAAGRARNRRVARDLISFLDGRRSPGTSPSDWDDARAVRLNLRSVPGLGQFDVDGLNENDKGRLFDDVSALLTLATAAVLIFGAATAALYADELQRNSALRALREEEDGSGGGADAGRSEVMRRRRLLARAARGE